MFEASGWKLEEPEVADHEKYDLIVPTIVKSPAEQSHDDVKEVSEKTVPCARLHTDSVC
jgi:hypothetical protein